MILTLISLIVALVSILLTTIRAFYIKDPQKRYLTALTGVCFSLFSLYCGLAISDYRNSKTLEMISENIGAVDFPDDVEREFFLLFSEFRGRIAKHDNPFLMRQSDQLVNQCLSEQRYVANGEVKVAPKDVRITAEQLMTEAGKAALATSVFAMDWRQRWGEEYWRKQSELANSLSLQRIFLLQQGASIAAASGVLRAHAETGVEVYYIESSELDDEENKDILIIDEKLVAVLELAPDGDISGGAIYADQQRVNEWTKRFESIRSRAKRYTLPESANGI